MARGVERGELARATPLILWGLPGPRRVVAKGERGGHALVSPDGVGARLEGGGSSRPRCGACLDGCGLGVLLVSTGHGGLLAGRGPVDTRRSLSPLVWRRWASPRVLLTRDGLFLETVSRANRVSTGVPFADTGRWATGDGVCGREPVYWTHDGGRRVTVLWAGETRWASVGTSRWVTG